MRVDLKFGRESLSFDIDDKKVGAVLLGAFPPPPDPYEEIREIKRALDNPIGMGGLSEVTEPGLKTVIMVSDITRPVPTHKFLPALLDALNAHGIKDTDITVLFGMGIHRAHTDDERRAMLGDEAYSRVKCDDSTGAPYIKVGVSKAGTPYHVSETVVNAGLVIGTGNVEYHWFAGYSGGAKAVLPGACDNTTITHNHSMIIHPNSLPGRLEGNPVREDIDAILEFIPIPYIFNVVIDDQKRILRAFAGHPVEAFRQACGFLDSVYKKPIDKLYDAVIAGCSGFPKDINVYQAQKALDNANLAVKDGGTIILVGSCSEGYGEDTFECWLKESSSPKDLLDRLKREFALGGHKAAGLAKVVERVNVIMISDMSKAAVEGLYFSYAAKDELQAVVDRVARRSESVLIIPQGGSILPDIGSSEPRFSQA
jgi:nickel-dependent lactate racemase